MARLGLLDGLKRWKVLIGGDELVLGKFTIKKGENKWMSLDNRVIAICPYYAWYFASGRYQFIVKCSDTITYGIDRYNYASILTIFAQREGGYQINEVRGEENRVTTDLNLDQVRARVVQWFKSNPMPELVSA